VQLPVAGLGLFCSPTSHAEIKAGVHAPVDLGGWESIMGSKRAATRTLMTQCDFTADSTSRTAAPAAGQDAAGVEGHSVDALEDALDKLYQHQVHAAPHHPPAVLIM
jgi:hypothetical protein